MILILLSYLIWAVMHGCGSAGRDAKIGGLFWVVTRVGNRYALGNRTAPDVIQLHAVALIPLLHSYPGPTGVKLCYVGGAGRGGTYSE
jgi:hypothetical protein